MAHKILYDADCQLCVKFATAIRRLDHSNQFELVNLQYHFSIDQSVPLDELEKNLHLIADDGSVLVGDHAFKFILQKIPAAKPLRYLIIKSSITSSLLFSGLNRIKRWTKSRYSLKSPCKRCGR